MWIGSCPVRRQSKSTISLLDHLLFKQDPIHTLYCKKKNSELKIVLYFSLHVGAVMKFCPLYQPTTENWNWYIQRIQRQLCIHWKLVNRIHILNLNRTWKWHFELSDKGKRRGEMQNWKKYLRIETNLVQAISIMTSWRKSTESIRWMKLSMAISVTFYGH